MERELSPMGRSKRMDAGKVRQQPRDVQALTWLAQMYGAPLDVVGRLLGTDEMSTRAVVRRWRRAGWAEQARVDAGPAWVWPTTATVNAFVPREFGGQWGAWKPSPMMAAHTRAVAEVRLAVAGADLEAWVSERMLAHREHGMKSKGAKLPHISDGVWLRGGTDQRDSVLIEVELTAKHPGRTKDILHTALMKLSSTRATEVWYVCGSAKVEALVTRVAEVYAREHNETWPQGLRVLNLEAVIEGREGREQ